MNIIYLNYGERLSMYCLAFCSRFELSQKKSSGKHLYYLKYCKQHFQVEFSEFHKLYLKFSRSPRPSLSFLQHLLETHCILRQRKLQRKNKKLFSLNALTIGRTRGRGGGGAEKVFQIFEKMIHISQMQIPPWNFGQTCMKFAVAIAASKMIDLQLAYRNFREDE